MVPDLRPSSPLSTGPTLFLASAPTEWQGRHFLNEFSPAARSCAEALPTAAIRIAATAQAFISNSMIADVPPMVRYIGLVGMMLRQICATDIRAPEQSA